MRGKLFGLVVVLFLLIPSVFAVTIFNAPTLGSLSQDVNFGGISGGNFSLNVSNVSSYIVTTVNPDQRDVYTIYPNGTVYAYARANASLDAFFNVSLETGLWYFGASNNGSGSTSPYSEVGYSGNPTVGGTWFTNGFYCGETGGQTCVTINNNGKLFQIQNVTFIVEDPVPPPSFDAFVTESSFSTQFTTGISVGNSFATVSSVTAEVLESTQQTYYVSTVTTSGGTGTATCRLNVDGESFGSTRTRSLSTGTFGNFRLMTTNVTLDPGNYTVSTECMKTGGPNYMVTGTTMSGHFLYDSEQNLNVTYAYDETGSLTLPSVFSPIFNSTFSTGQNFNSSTTNNLFLVTNWRASPVYTATGNISVFVSINDVSCANYTRFGESGSVGSMAGVCMVGDLLNGTDYVVSLNAEGVGGIDAQFNTKELVQHNQSVNSSIIRGVSVSSNTLTSLSELTITNLLGSSYNIFMEVGVNIDTGSTTTDANLALQETSLLRNNTRTISAPSGQPGNVLAEGLSGVSGVTAKTIDLLVACGNSDCVVNSADFVGYVTDSADAPDNTFVVTSFDLYNGTTLDFFNVTIGGGTINTTTGSVTVISNDSFPSVSVQSSEYFINVSVHDRTTNLNASLVRWTLVQAVTFDGGIVISNFTANVDGGVNYTTENGVLFLPLQFGTFNVSLSNVNHDGEEYANIDEQITADPFLQSFNFSINPTNSIFLSFFDLSEFFPIDFQNVSVLFSKGNLSFSNTSNTSEMIASNLEVGTWTIKAESEGYEDAQYFVTVSAKSTQNLNVFLLNSSLTGETTFTIKDSGDTNPIGGAVFTMQQLVNGSFVTIGQETTDAFGVTFWNLVQGDSYKFTIEADGYTTKVGNFTRTTSAYTVALTASNIQGFVTYLSDFSYVLTPEEVEQELTNFTLTVSSPDGRMEWFSITVVHTLNTSFLVNVTGSPSGGTAILSVDLSNVTGVVRATYRMKSTSFGEPLEIDRSWYVQSIGDGNFTYTDFMEFYADDDNGFTWVSRGLIMTVIAVLGAILVGVFFGVDAAVLMASMVYLLGGFFGWLHWGVVTVVVGALLSSIIIRGGRL